MPALAFGTSDEKEIVLKRGAPIELIDVPFDLSFAIDGTPEALIRASEEIERFVDEKEGHGNSKDQVDGFGLNRNKQEKPL